MKIIHKWWFILILTLVGIFLLGMCVFLYLYEISPVTDSFTIELGEDVSEDLDDYVTGRDWSLEKTKLNIEEIDTSRVGTYYAYADHGWQHFVFPVEIVDTTAPAFTKKDGPIFCKPGDYYDPSCFYAEIYDASGMIEVSFSDREEKTVSFDKTGIYHVFLQAIDFSGNTSDLEVTVHVDTAPEIYNVGTYYIAQGDRVNLLEGVIAFDKVDGDVTDSLRIDYGSFQWNTLGSQILYFVANDQNGLETRVPVTVNIWKTGQIMEKIAKREISPKTDVISFVPNYYEAGYGAFETPEEQMEYLLPSIIHIDADYESENILYVHGSGFILTIDEQYVYICSNQHVMKYTETGIAYFFDGNTARYEVVGLNEEEDVAIARIPIEEIPEETFEQLFSIHISERAYENILQDHETLLFMDITNDKGLDYVSTGYSIEENSDFYVVNEDCLEVTINMKSGNSGSAVIDEYGNLIGMCVGLRYDDGDDGEPMGYRYFCIPLRVLLENYEAMTGNEIYRFW